MKQKEHKSRSLSWRILLVLFSISLSTLAQAQSITVKGNVVDPNGEPLIGVTITEHNTTNGAITDINGNFSITCVKGATLKFSYIGYKDVTKTATGTNLKVVLTEDSQALDEVVVVGYGTQKKVNLTGAVGSVDAADLTKRVSPNASSMLQGRVPGLQIVQNSANPGAEQAAIQIRGQGTFSDAGSNPLVLIDGVEGDMNKVNPNMIENITVLKDAASASIYGSRAANGVILITTKNGTEGRLNIDYNFNMAWQSPTTKQDRITNSAEYMTLFNKALTHTGGDIATKGYKQEWIDAYKNAAPGDPMYPNHDWYDDIIKTAPMQQHFLSVNGGKNGTTYNFGLGYLDQDGMVIKTGYKRYDAQMNLKTNLGGRVTFGTNINFSKSQRHSTSYTSGGNQIDNNETEDMILCMYAQGPYYTPYLPDGRFCTGGYSGRGHNKAPLAVAYSGGGKKFDENYVLGSAFAKVKIIDGLDAEVKASVRYNQLQSKCLTVSVKAYKLHPDEFGNHEESTYNSDVNTLTVRQETEMQYTLYGTLNYKKTFADKHNLNVMLGYNQENFKYDKIGGYRTGVPTNTHWELDVAPTAGQTNEGGAYEWAIQSYFGRLNYDFMGKYLFEASFRYDGTSRLASGKRWGLFPSFSAGWRVSEENFLKNVEWISNLKVRGSWGQLGNQNIGNYPYQDLLTAVKYNFGGQVSQGFTQDALSNPEIKWETTTAVDFGVDFGFFNNRLFGSIDWYKKTTKDILRELQVPTHIGVSAPMVNDGTMENKGWEFVLGHENRIGNFTYSISANLETYRNKLVKFGAREINSGNGTIKQEGLPWSSYYMYVFDGIYQNQSEIDNGPKPLSNLTQPGDMKYKDISGPDGVPDGKITPDDRVVVDGAFPKFNYGFTINAAYKGFDLSLFFQGVEGKKIYVKEWGIAPFRQASVPSTFWRGAWDGEGTSNSIPHIFNDNYAPNTAVSTWWLQDGSYLRMKNIQIGYTLPKAWLSKIHFQNVRIYFSGDNLLTFTDFFQGLDPERTAQNSRGAIYPQAKVVSFGLKVTL